MRRRALHGSWTRRWPAPAALTIGALALAAATLASGRGEPAVDPFDAAAARLLAGASDPARWTAAPADGVALHLATTLEDGRPALAVEVDFQGHGGWAALRLPLGLDLPDDYELTFAIRGTLPRNDLEVKLLDASGENVWWSVRRGFDFGAEWRTVRVRRSQVSFAWGPAGAGAPLRHLAALELAFTAGEGGRGRVLLRDVTLRRRLPAAPASGPPTAAASASVPGHPPAAGMDGDSATAWRTPAGSAHELVVDLGARRELGGVSLYWEAERQPTRMAVAVLAEDGGGVLERTVERAGGGRTDIQLPEAEGRWLRLRLLDGPAGGYGLAELVVRPNAFAASRNALVEAIAGEAPRGSYPRAWQGEQTYWTVVGVDGAEEESLVSEDGAIELGTTRASLEPFLWLADPEGSPPGGRVLTWADARIRHDLVDGELPIPSVHWDVDAFAGQAPASPPEANPAPAPAPTLTVTAFADGSADRSWLATRYRLHNASDEPRRGSFYLALRPLQVNPPQQFLNLAGGTAPLARVACRSGALAADDRTVHLSPSPTACGAAPFAAGGIDRWLAAGTVPADAAVDDPEAAASALLAWPFALAPGEALTVVASTAYDPAADTDAAALAADGDAGFAAALARVADRWRNALGPVALTLPRAQADLAHTLRAGLAANLIHRDGPRIQPGSRAYARSWIRDGALTGAALVRLGHAGVARDFATWFAGYQYAGGKVPCCVDRRGADPVPEHDSHGQLVHLIAEVVRTTGDRAFAAAHWSNVQAAAAHLDALRAERRGPAYAPATALPDERVFFGLLPPSISHEGYSAKPVHSYWDDTFAYRGYQDAAWLATLLGDAGAARRLRASAEELGHDLAASIAAVRARDGLATLPASADLGDFDPTSATALLEPGGLLPRLPADAVAATWDRYLAEHRRRRVDTAAWDVYTPYELRNVQALIRLGRREDAHQLLAFLLAGRRPAAWRQWAEVVGREPREPRFIGDLPHGWVASDFARALLDAFAYEDRANDRLVLAAGIPRDWLAGGEEVGVDALATPWGPLRYRLRFGDDHLEAHIDGLVALPPGGVVLAPPLGRHPGAVEVDGTEVAARCPPFLPLPTLPTTVRITNPW